MNESVSEQRLNFLRKSIGATIQNSPSNYMNWLAPVLVQADYGVYFGSVSIKNTRYAIGAMLLADLVGVITAICLSYLFFG